MIPVTADIAIVGAGPAGLSAAIQASLTGASVLIIDENKVAGGQLFKQIHKFFGSREHRAGIRGSTIGKQLLEELQRQSNVTVMLESVAYGVFGGDTLGVFDREHNYEVKAQKYILASGGLENYLSFPGSTLPGVMGAGAAQTMININHVLPGEQVVMLGSGNVGLIVSYQLMQAGAHVKALIEAAPKIGGYGVHASKIARNSVPILTSHTVVQALGTEYLEGVEVAQVDEHFCPVSGTEQVIPCDTLCLAVGLNPLTELAWMAGCKMYYESGLGGHIPVHDESMKTSNDRFYVAGDICGVEEASTAMEEGNLAGIAAAESIGLIDREVAARQKAQVQNKLDALRTGYFGQRRRQAKERLIAAYYDWKERGDVHA